LEDSQPGNVKDTKPVSGVKKVFLKIGGVLAVVLHPCFLFFYYVLMVISEEKNVVKFSDVWFIIILTFMLTVLIPALFPIIKGKDIYLKDRKKRRGVIIFTIFCYLFCYIGYSLYSMKVSETIYKLCPESQFVSMECRSLNITQFLLENATTVLLYLSIGLFVVFIINERFKISLHACGIGFIIWGFLLHFHTYKGAIWAHVFFGIVIGFSGLILLWQRVASGSHTKKEVIVGLILTSVAPIIIFIGIFTMMLLSAGKV